MSLQEKLQIELAQEYGINSCKELENAIKEMELIDISLFVIKQRKVVKKDENIHFAKDSTSQERSRKRDRVHSGQQNSKRGSQVVCSEMQMCFQR